MIVIAEQMKGGLPALAELLWMLGMFVFGSLVIVGMFAAAGYGIYTAVSWCMEADSPAPDDDT